MRDDNCIFCKIANGDIPSATVYEDDEFRVILDLGPMAKGHALILPKSHYKDICEAEESVASKLFPLAAKIGAAAKKGLGAGGFNVLQNNGACAGQTIAHLHVHVIPRYEDGASSITWEPGKADAEELAQIAELIQKAL